MPRKGIGGPRWRIPLGSNPANVDAPWELPLTPEGIYYALRYFARKFPGAPLFIVESGMPTDNGRPRADGWDRADELRDTIYRLQRITVPTPSLA